MKIELKKETKKKIKYNDAGNVYVVEEIQYWCTIDDRYIEGSLALSEEEAYKMYDILKESKGEKIVETIKSETI